jgi:6-phospho-beta-glucosidase
VLLLQDEYGGFNSSRVVDDFVYYADTVFNQLGRFVKTWVTFNEPLVTCDMGFKAGEATGHAIAC